MSYTTDRQPQGLLKDIKTLLREGMIAELVAINDYSHIIKLTDNKEIVEILHHIMEDEKRHYGEFLNTLRSLDNEHTELEEEAKEHVNVSKKNSIKEYSAGKGNKQNILTYIRELIKGELEAVVLYDHIVDYLDDAIIIALIHSISRDEKEHIEELTRVLLILDSDTYGPLKL